MPTGSITKDIFKIDDETVADRFLNALEKSKKNKTQTSLKKVVINGVDFYYEDEVDLLDESVDTLNQLDFPQSPPSIKFKRI